MPYVPRDDRKRKQKNSWFERALPAVAIGAAGAVAVSAVAAAWSFVAVERQSAQLRALEQSNQTLAATLKDLKAFAQTQRADSVAALKQAAQMLANAAKAQPASASAPVAPSHVNAPAAVETASTSVAAAAASESDAPARVDLEVQPAGGLEISGARLSGFLPGKNLYAAMKVATGGAATKVSWRSGLGIGPYPLTGAYDMGRAFISCDAIGAHERHAREFNALGMLHKNGARLLKAGVDNVKHGKAAVYFFGRVCYNDASNARRYKDFCLYWTGPHTPYREPSSCSRHNGDSES